MWCVDNSSSEGCCSECPQTAWGPLSRPARKRFNSTSTLPKLIGSRFVMSFHGASVENVPCTVEPCCIDCRWMSGTETPTISLLMMMVRLQVENRKMKPPIVPKKGPAGCNFDPEFTKDKVRCTFTAHCVVVDPRGSCQHAQAPGTLMNITRFLLSNDSCSERVCGVYLSLSACIVHCR